MSGSSEKDDPADVAKVGFEAMMNGDSDVVADGRTSSRRLWQLLRQHGCSQNNIEEWLNPARRNSTDITPKSPARSRVMIAKPQFASSRPMTGQNDI